MDFGYPAPKRWSSNSWLWFVGWGCTGNKSAHVFFGENYCIQFNNKKLGNPKVDRFPSRKTVCFLSNFKKKQSFSWFSLAGVRPSRVISLQLRAGSSDWKLKARPGDDRRNYPKPETKSQQKHLKIDGVGIRWSFLLGRLGLFFRGWEMTKNQVRCNIYNYYFCNVFIGCIATQQLWTNKVSYAHTLDCNVYVLGWH